MERDCVNSVTQHFGLILVQITLLIIYALCQKLPTDGHPYTMIDTQHV